MESKTNTGRIIPNKKPNIMIHDNDKETCLLMDTEITGNGNMIKKKKEAEIFKNTKKLY